MQIEPPRERVFQDVLGRGPVSAAGIASRLGVTAAAVRRHLESLETAGLVTSRPATGAAPRGRGRPARTYVVSGAGQRAAASSYEELALSAVAHLEHSYGPDAVTRFVEQRVADLEDRWRGAVEAAGPDPLARTRALAAELDGDGFAAGVRTVGAAGVSGAQLCQGHCPVSAMATAHPDLCEAETRAFSRLLGVHVQRLATIAHGDHVCTTFVPTSVTAARSQT